MVPCSGRRHDLIKSGVGIDTNTAAIVAERVRIHFGVERISRNYLEETKTFDAVIMLAVC